MLLSDFLLLPESMLCCCSIVDLMVDSLELVFLLLCNGDGGLLAGIAWMLVIVAFCFGAIEISVWVPIVVIFCSDCRVCWSVERIDYGFGFMI